MNKDFKIKDGLWENDLLVAYTTNEDVELNVKKEIVENAETLQRQGVEIKTKEEIGMIEEVIQVQNSELEPKEENDMYEKPITFTEKLYVNDNIGHTALEPYQCRHCGKDFTNNSELIIHMSIHTGDKPYQCSYCGKDFLRKSDLKRHMKTHTKEKPYRCSHCDE
ncbi:unnamed protein product, partial [Meganyctiphanes norvegica]